MTLGELFTFLGYATGALVLVWAAIERRIATEGMGTVLAAGVFGGILGAKLCQLLFEGWPLRIAFLQGLNPDVGGRALLGGLIFGWISVEAAKWRLGIRRSTGDLFALALPAGEAVGRIGCYFNQCCYGTSCSEPWAVYQHGEWRHPAQIYTAVVCAAIFVSLLSLRRKLRQEGDLFKMYLVLFGSTRFMLEFVRQNDSYWLGLTPMQWFCLEISVFGVASLALRRMRTLTT